MSTQFNVYARQTRRLLLRELKPALELAEWSAVSLGNDGSPMSGVVGSTLFVWELGHPKAEALEELALKAPVRLLEEYGEELAVAEVDVEAPFDSDPEFLEELESCDIAEEVVSAVAAAKAHYWVRVSPSTDRNVKFAEDLALLIGILTNGIFEDEEEGTFQDLSDEGVAIPCRDSAL